jgi:hypothetical protein
MPTAQQQQQQQQQARGATRDSDGVDDEDGPQAAAGPAAKAPAVVAAGKPGDAATAAPAASADEPLLLPGYSVGAVVGEGGFCAVRLAVHHLSRRKVAVKVIDRSKLSDAGEARRMQREIRVMKRLNHPSVIRLFEVLESGPALLLVMEYAPGGSLLDYVRARKRLGEGEAAFFLQQMVTGLQYCHDCEVSCLGVFCGGGGRGRGRGRPRARECWRERHACRVALAAWAATTHMPGPRPKSLMHACTRWCTATSSWRTSCLTGRVP